MTVPTDPEPTSRRQSRSAGRLFGGLAAAFVVATGTAIVLASAGSPSSGTPSTGESALPGSVTIEAPTTTMTAPAAAIPAPAEPSTPGAIPVRLGEFSFSPQKLSVPAGRPVTFFVTNPGVVDHEMVIGDAHVQEEAEAAMQAMQAGGHAGHGRAGHHGEEMPSIYLKPGESGELTVTFPKAGEVLIGCHVPGHWAAGMRGALQVG